MPIKFIKYSERIIRIFLHQSVKTAKFFSVRKIFSTGRIFPTAIIALFHKRSVLFLQIYICGKHRIIHSRPGNLKDENNEVSSSICFPRHSVKRKNIDPRFFFLLYCRRTVNHLYTSVCETRHIISVSRRFLICAETNILGKFSFFAISPNRIKSGRGIPISTSSSQGINPLWRTAPRSVPPRA